LRLVAIVALTTAVFVLACSANTIPMITNVSVETVGDSPLGIVDPVGNVWEWCSDVIAVVDYGTFSCATRPLRGGSWATAMPELDDPVKDLCPLYRTETIGFRCFRSIRPTH
jgi:formylglycine-generating enzyme required for sulfatase activity